MRPGRLKDRVMIQTATYSEGEYEDLETWGDHKSRACDIRPVRAIDYYQGAGDNIDGVYEIRFRYERGLFTEKVRLIDRRVSPNRIFEDIVIVDQGNRHLELVITATHRKYPAR